MKRIFTICLLFLLLSGAASAQRGVFIRRERPASSITRLERLQLQKDVLRFKLAQRRAERDGIVSPYERRNLQKMKRKTRRDAFRFRHNGRNRVI